MSDDSIVFQTVRRTIELARAGKLNLKNDRRSLLRNKDDAAVAVTILRSSYAFKDRVPGWYEFRDRTVKTWPSDASSIQREMHGLLTAVRGKT